jgi:hypothetical protein
MSEKSTKLLEYIRTSRPALAIALPEMLVYQAVMRSKTAYYHYPLPPRDLDSAIQRGLMATRERVMGTKYRTLVRLTKHGREIAKKLRAGRAQ